MPLSSMGLSWIVALALPTVAPAVVRAPDTAVEPRKEHPGAIVLGPAARGDATIIDAQGQVVAHVTLVPGRATTVGVPAGHYRVESEGHAVAEVDVGDGETFVLARPPTLTAAPPPSPTPRVQTPTARPASAAPGRSGDGVRPARRSTRTRKPWKPVVAPLASVVLPGAGQVITKRPGRGMAFFTGTVGMTIGAAALWATANRTEGATRGDQGDSGAVEILRLGGVAALGGAAALLYVGQILDAYGGAVGKVGRGINPVKDHVVALEVQRSSTVGFAAGQPEYKLMSDYSLAVMGQAAPRVTVGVSDLSIKLEPSRDGVVVQGGVRSAYRFWDRRRLWLAAGGGLVLQGTSAQRQVAATDLGTAGDEGRVSAFMYAMLDARIFVLDRWALLVVPRVSLPFSERRFGRDKVIPRFSTTFELALGGAVHF